jgi:plastocyanin
MRTRFLIGFAAMALVACAPQAEPTQTDPIAISVADFMIVPEDVTADGPSVTFEVTNDGPTPHNVTLRNEAGEVVAATADLSAGESETLEADLPPGAYTILCSLAGHASLGMTGTLTVTGP